MNIERLHELFEVDASTGALRRRIGRSDRAKAGDEAGWMASKGYLQVRVDGKRLLVHRIVFAMTNGYVPEQVDHINGVRTDNRPSNLRAATNAENSHNSRMSSRNKSGFKGVSWDKDSRKWAAMGMAYGKKHHLGFFVDIHAAAQAAHAFREKHHGAFARHA